MVLAVKNLWYLLLFLTAPLLADPSVGPGNTLTPTATSTATVTQTLTLAPTQTPWPTATPMGTIGVTCLNCTPPPTPYTAPTPYTQFTQISPFTQVPQFTQGYATPCYSGTSTISPTFSASPTITQTFTKSPTVTVSPTPTPTQSPGAWPDVVVNLKDMNRTNLIWWGSAIPVAATTTEFSITMTAASATSLTTSAMSLTITSGEILRITSITVGQIGSATATLANSTIHFRLSTTGLVTVTTQPIIWTWRLETPATADAQQILTTNYPDGIEFKGNGTVNIGFTANSTFALNGPTLDIALTGFYYYP